MQEMQQIPNISLFTYIYLQHIAISHSCKTKSAIDDGYKTISSDYRAWFQRRTSANRARETSRGSSMSGKFFPDWEVLPSYSFPMGHFHWFLGASPTSGSHGFHCRNLRARDNSFSAWTETESNKTIRDGIMADPRSL